MSLLPRRLIPFLNDVLTSLKHKEMVRMICSVALVARPVWIWVVNWHGILTFLRTIVTIVFFVCSISHCVGSNVLFWVNEFTTSSRLHNRSDGVTVRFKTCQAGLILESLNELFLAHFIIHYTSSHLLRCADINWRHFDRLDQFLLHQRFAFRFYSRCLVLSFFNISFSLCCRSMRCVPKIWLSKLKKALTV